MLSAGSGHTDPGSRLTSTYWCWTLCEKMATPTPVRWEPCSLQFTRGKTKETNGRPGCGLGGLQQAQVPGTFRPMERPVIGTAEGLMSLNMLS